MIDELQAAAYHEAGHAIMHLLRDVPFDDVTIVPTNDYFGVVNLNIGPNMMLNLNIDSRSREIGALARDMILILFAGGLAEEAFTGHYNNLGVSSDLDKVEFIAFHRSRNPQAYIRKIKSDARRIIKENWRDVTKLANALLEKNTLSSSEVYALMEQESEL